MIFKKSQSFIELPFIRLINLKFLIPENQKFSYKICFCQFRRPLDSAAPLTPSATPLFLTHICLNEQSEARKQ
jgi:hypothetical protein